LYNTKVQSLYSPYPDSSALISGDVRQLTTGCTDRTAADCDEIELLRLLEASTTYSTRRSYDSDLRHFTAWGGSLPAVPVDVARYLAAYAGRLSVATLARRLVAIGQASTLRGFPNPARTDLVRRTMRGVRRTYGAPQRRVAAITTDDLLSMSSVLGNSLVELRDRALLLLGFAGAFRRSEIVAIDCGSVDRCVHGLVITIPRSKADQEGRGREVAIQYGRRACPVEALDAWLSASKIAEGAVFRSMLKGGRVGQRRLSPDAVSRIVKHRASAAGLDPARYSGHSLRAGFVTSAATAGIPTWRIKAQTGHATDAMVSRYIRQAALLQHDVDQTVL
jgi:integrase